jgi:hypothetical protein
VFVDAAPHWVDSAGQSLYGGRLVNDPPPSSRASDRPHAGFALAEGTAARGGHAQTLFRLCSLSKNPLSSSGLRSFSGLWESDDVFRSLSVLH